METHVEAPPSSDTLDSLFWQKRIYIIDPKEQQQKLNDFLFFILQASRKISSFFVRCIKRIQCCWLLFLLDRLLLLRQFQHVAFYILASFFLCCSVGTTKMIFFFIKLHEANHHRQQQRKKLALCSDDDSSKMSQIASFQLSLEY